MDHLHPSYDINNCEWYIEHDGEEVAAPTIRELKDKFPEHLFVGYHPQGYVAVREGFLQASNRVPFITSTKVRGRNIAARRRMAEQQEKEIAEVKIKRISTIKKAEVQLTEQGVLPPKKLNRQGQIDLMNQYEARREELRKLWQGGYVPRGKEVDHEMVMNMYAIGYKSMQIAVALDCSIAAVQCHRVKAFRDGDPRAKAKNYRVVVKRPHNCSKWIPAEDQELRRLAETGFSAAEISQRLDRTRNSVIGRCARIGVKLQGSNGGGGYLRQPLQRVRYEPKRISLKDYESVLA